MSRDQAIACRAALKAAGYSARQVTCRADGYRDLTITIRDASVRKSAIEAIAAPIAPSYQIYADGDPFMARGFRVEYLATITDPIADEIERRILAADGRAVAIGDFSLHAARTDFPYNASVSRFEGSERCGRHYCQGIRHAAERVAVELLDLGRADLAREAAPLPPSRPTLTLVPPAAPRRAADPATWLDSLDL